MEKSNNQTKGEKMKQWYYLGILFLLLGNYRAEASLPNLEDLVIETVQGELASSQLDYSDLDSNSLSFEIITQPENGNASINMRWGRVWYQPRGSFSGTDSFLVSVKDAYSGPIYATVTANIAINPNPPIALDQEFETDEEQYFSGQLKGENLETTNGRVRYSINSLPQNGNLFLNPVTGVFWYNPQANFVGEDSFTYKVAINSFESEIATVSIQVHREAHYVFYFEMEPGNAISDFGLKTIKKIFGDTRMLIVSDPSPFHDGSSYAQVDNRRMHTILTGAKQGELEIQPSQFFKYTSNLDASGTDVIRLETKILNGKIWTQEDSAADPKLRLHKARIKIVISFCKPGDACASNGSNGVFYQNAYSHDSKFTALNFLGNHHLTRFYTREGSREDYLIWSNYLYERRPNLAPIEGTIGSWNKFYLCHKMDASGFENFYQSMGLNHLCN